MSSPAHAIIHGSIMSTGSAIDIKTIGFRPKMVMMEMGGISTRWQKTMADASAYKRLANGAGSLVSANGITPLADGFRIGTDTDINPASPALIHYTAIAE